LWLIFFVPSALALYYFSDIDLQLQRHFYRVGEGFYRGNTPLMVFIYELVPWVTKTVVTLSLLAVAYVYLRRHASRIRVAWTAAYLLLALALGPGLLVNTVFKDHWGRARPNQLEEFGGHARFTPPFVIAKECKRNCSFVSGHASIGFYLVAFALLFRGYPRLWLGLLGIGLGMLSGYVRIVQGGHFFSDVILSGFFTVLVVLLCYRYLLEPRHPPATQKS
jgi:lipid A 4'-phosphatase